MKIVRPSVLTAGLASIDHFVGVVKLHCCVLLSTAQKVTSMGWLNLGPQMLQYLWFRGSSGTSGQAG